MKKVLPFWALLATSMGHGKQKGPVRPLNVIPDDKVHGAFGNNHGSRIIRAIFKDDSIRKQEHLRFVREDGWREWATPRFLLGRNNFHPGRNRK